MTAPANLPPMLRAESLAEQAYQAIREGIATGVFAAGERVTERGLAARLDVSPTPVREALRRLQQESLIERVSARQLRVVDHSSDTLRELMLTAATLRALEARFATAKISDAALDRMTALVGRLADAVAGELEMSNAESLRLAREFDVEIEEAAGNATLRGMILSLAVMGPERRNRSVESMRRHQDVAENRLQNHRDLLAAFRARDPDAVERIFREHAVSGMEMLLDAPE
jgi:DNA-binding GntR family transcriptional regulator